MRSPGLETAQRGLGLLGLGFMGGGGGGAESVLGALDWVGGFRAQVSGFGFRVRCS